MCTSVYKCVTSVAAYSQTVHKLTSVAAYSQTVHKLTSVAAYSLWVDVYTFIVEITRMYVSLYCQDVNRM